MQQTKHYIEGVTAAHAGSIRACRYNTSSSRAEWLAGFDSVDRSHVVFNISGVIGAKVPTVSDLDPVYVGSLSRCIDKAVTLELADRKGRYVVYVYATGKPYLDPY